MAEIIKFPKTPREKISKNAEEIIKMQAQKKRIETDLNVIIGGASWDMYNLTQEDIEVLGLFGDVMKFDPTVGSRLISKLAEQLKRVQLRDLEDLIWAENLEMPALKTM